MNKKKLFIISFFLPHVLFFNNFLYAKQNIKNFEEIIEKIPPIEVKQKRNYCLNCHLTLKGKLSKPVKEWENSVHATAENKCHLCHGGNPAINNKIKAKSVKYYFIGKPSNKVVTAFCGRGRCHEVALEQFKRGPHYESVLKSNHPNCTDCHGSHNIQRSSRNIISDKTCTGCHPVEYSKMIIESITEIDEGFSYINENLKYLKSKYVNVENIEQRTDKVKHLFHQLVHVFSSDEINSTKKIVEVEVKNLISESNLRVATTRRLDFLYIAMLSIVVAIIIGILSYTIYMYSRRR